MPSLHLCLTVSPIPASSTSSSFVDARLLSSITPSLFHHRLKTHLFHRCFQRDFPSLGLHPRIITQTVSYEHHFSFFSLSFCFFFGCGRLSWLVVSVWATLIYVMVSYRTEKASVSKTRTAWTVLTCVRCLFDGFLERTQKSEALIPSWRANKRSLHSCRRRSRSCRLVVGKRSYHYFSRSKKLQENHKCTRCRRKPWVKKRSL